MRTLLGIFHSLERGRAARDRFQEAGYDVELLDQSSPTANITHELSERGGEGREGSAAAGATLGGLMGGGIGALPGAALGRVMGDWLSDKRAEEYARDVANGGALLIVRAEELVPAAEAESLLYELGADHVENGERPVD
jgi:hypothetical protein